MTHNPAIIVVAFNRPNSLKRLLASLKNAHYPNTQIPLVISIDKSDSNQDVLEIAQNFAWSFGEKKIYYQEENLGLRKHILTCGNLTETYGSVIVLEDDLYVSPNFYPYTVAALKYSENKEYIGGISLYNHKTNVHTGEYFCALEDGFDNWYFQFASSWGQAWTQSQWSSFLTWYNKTSTLEPSSQIPEYVLSWSEKSWLKYFISYLIKHNKYFLYPKISLSTNFSDAGTHATDDSTIFQTELFMGKKTDYVFSELEESQAVYDAFFETEALKHHFKKEGLADVEIDLYGYRECTKRYFLSSKNLDFKIIKGYSRSLKPMELNIISNLDGDDFYLYDTRIEVKNTIVNKTKKQFRRVIYSTKHVGHKSANLLSRYIFMERLQNKFKQLFK